MNKVMLAVVLSLAATVAQAEDWYETAHERADEATSAGRDMERQLREGYRENEERRYRDEQTRLQRQQNAIEYDLLRSIRGY